MAKVFTTPSGSPVVGYTGPSAIFNTGTPNPESGTGPIIFSTPSGSPVVGYTGPSVIGRS